MVAGYSDVGKGNQDIFLARHLANGSLDPVFDGGGDGIVLTSLGTNFDEAHGLALQPDGKIVLSGSTGFSRDFVTLRYVGTAATASHVILGGQIIDSWERPLRGIRVTLSGGSLPEPLTVLTSSFGYYAFYDLPVGQTYTVTPSHNDRTFSPTSLQITLADEYWNANFTAIE